MSSKWLFGITNIRWGIKELIKLGSAQPSFFSKKRIESGIAFWVLMSGCVFWLITKVATMTTSDFIIWAVVPATVCGYYIGKIEAAKSVISEVKSEVTYTETKTEPKENV